MRVLVEGHIEVWIFPSDPEKVVRCFFGEMEIDINLLDLEVFAVHDQTNRIFQQKARQVVAKHREHLLDEWDEMNAL